MTAPSMHALNSSFYERDDLRQNQEGMQLLVNSGDAQARSLADGQRVVAFKAQGEVTFLLQVTNRAPVGTVVAEGSWRWGFAPGARTVNALTAQRLTDAGGGSTCYDNTVKVRAEG